MRSSMAVAIFVVCGLASSPAHAERNRRTAKVLAIAGTTASSALIVTSLLLADREPVHKPLFIAGLGSAVVTPSLGQYYAGEYFTIGMAVRLAAGGLAVYAVTAQTEDKRCGLAVEDRCKELTQEAVVLLGIAAIGFIGGMAYDVYDASDAVDRYHRKHGIYVNAARAIDGSPVPVAGISGSF